MRKLIDFMMTHPLFAGTAGILVALFSLRGCNTAGDPLSEGIIRMLLAGTMAFFLYFVSREKTLQKCGVETGYVVRVLSPMLITSAVLGGLSTASGFISHAPMQPNWIANFFLTLFEMLFVGSFALSYGKRLARPWTSKRCVKPGDGRKKGHFAKCGMSFFLAYPTAGTG